MEVFVLLGCTDYDGDEVLGVYASLAEAEAARDVINKRMRWDGYDIQSHVIGAPAQAGWEK